MMEEKIFSEAIKVKDGVFYNLPLHINRMARTMQHFFSSFDPISLNPEMIPQEAQKGIFKCRVLYSDKIISVEYIPYTFRTIGSISIVRDNDIDFTYKYVDRDHLNRLLKSSGTDEIIIIKNKHVTDASSSNLVFEDAAGKLYTPSTCLLQGTKRELLLQQGKIQQIPILEKDICNFHTIRLINAMIDLEDNINCPVSLLHHS